MITKVKKLHYTAEETGSVASDAYSISYDDLISPPEKRLPKGLLLGEITHPRYFAQFGPEVADLVNEVTHEGTKDDWGYYFPRLKSKEGILIKLCDRASNISRMDSWSEKRQQHY